MVTTFSSDYYLHPKCSPGTQKSKMVFRMLSRLDHVFTGIKKPYGRGEAAGMMTLLEILADTHNDEALKDTLADARQAFTLS